MSLANATQAHRENLQRQTQVRLDKFWGRRATRIALGAGAATASVVDPNPKESEYFGWI
jgi:hypothetical protein